MRSLGSFEVVVKLSRRLVVATAAVGVLLTLGCGKEKSKDNGQGSANIMARIKSATPDQIQSLRVTVTAPDITVPLVSDLAKDAAGNWRGTMTGIPAGPKRTFTAQARGAWGEILYQGSAEADVLANQTAVVMLSLQEATPPTPFVNSIPYFTSLVASSSRVPPGGRLDLKVVAVDPDNDVLIFTWSATGGSYSGADPADGGAGTVTGDTVAWNAPAEEGSFDLTVVVSDGKGGTASLTMTVSVGANPAQTGSADIEVNFNTWPLVSSMTGSPSPMSAGSPINLTVVASDPDGDTLSYAWVSNCSGTFSPSATEQNPTFTLEAGATASDCTFTVTLSDSRGGHNTGALGVHVGAVVVPTVTVLSVSPKQGLITSEEGGTATFMVWLKGPPEADVTVPITSEDTSEGSVSPSSLVFAPDSWSVPQVVTVTGAPDDGDTADQDYTVRVGPSTSTDPLFSGIAAIRVSLTNQDPQAVRITTTTLVSVAAGGGSGNMPSGQQYKATHDARIVAFSSDASNLVTGDSNGVTDVFVRDMKTGTTTRVSVATNGTQSNGVSTLVDLSPDGRYVLFDSYADNLVPGDTNTRMDVFLHDRQTHVTSRMSVRTIESSPDGGTGSEEQSPNDSSGLGIIGNGTYVALQSSLCPGNPWSWGPCLRNIQTGTWTPMPWRGWNPEGSADGRYILSGNYLFDLTTGTETQVDVSSDGTEGNGGWSSFHMSSDARYIVFESSSTNLVPGDTNGANDIFLRDRTAGTTTRVSTSASGSQALGNSSGPTISRDGRYVVFVSDAKNLVPGDTTAESQAFVRDLTTGELTQLRSWTPPWYPPGYGYCYSARISTNGKHVLCTGGWPHWVHDLGSGTTGVFGDDWNGDPELNGGQFLAGDHLILFNSSANRAGDTNGMLDLFITPVPTINVGPF